MFYFVLLYYLDLVFFAIATLFVVYCADWRVLRPLSVVWPRVQVWTCMVVCMAIGIGGALWLESIQRARLRVGIQGVAPTYAVAMELMGHDRVQLDSAPNDPTYLSIIEQQKAWLADYPAITDIYTMRLTGPDKIALIIDSETDYNHDGEYNEEREQRTEIGEIYPEVSAAMRAAAEGESVFDDVPISDRWGTTVSAYTPMRDAKGNIEAIVGIDFAAADWIRTLLLARGCVQGFAMTALLGLVVPITISSLKRAELIKEQRHYDELQTQKWAVEDSLRKLASYQLVLDAHALVCVVDSNGTILHVNEKYSALYGVPTEQLLGMPHEALHKDDRPPNVWSAVQSVVSSGETWRGEVCSRDKFGETLWIDATVVPLFDAAHCVTQQIILGTDITEKKRYETELVKAARLDRLTGLPNRTLLIARLQYAISRARATDDSQFALLFLDFDRFKHTNDSLGHDVGDQLLQQIAYRITHVLQPVASTDLHVVGHTVARLGGDEFVAVVHGVRTFAAASEVAEQLLDVLNCPYQLGEHLVNSTASIGIALYHEQYESYEHILRDADFAMYQAKAKGRGCYWHAPIDLGSSIASADHATTTGIPQTAH